MIRALYHQTIRARRLSWFIYSALGFTLLFVYLATFPAVQAQQATYDQLLNSMPKAILEVFNIGKSAPTLMGFLSAKHFGFTWPLMISLLMISYSGGAIAKEIDNRTMGLLFSLPISRLKLYLVRLAAGITGLTIFVVFSELLLWPLAQMFHYALPWGDAARVGILGFFFGLTVLCLSLMISSMTSESGKVYGTMGGLLLVMYVLDIIASLEDKLANAKYFSLFHYFAPGDVINGGQLDLTALLIFTVVSIIAAIIGGAVFRRRDMSV